MSALDLVVLSSETEPSPRRAIAPALVAAAQDAGLEAVAVGPGQPVPPATLAIALDERALERAPAGAYRVALPASFDPTWQDPAADAVLVAHRSLADRLAPGARRRAHVVGPVGPALEPLEPDEELPPPVVAIAPDVVLAVGPTPLLVQLSLVSARVTFLFAVGEDVELAEALRTFGAGHVSDGSRAGLFASEDEARVLGRAAVWVGTPTGGDLAAGRRVIPHRSGHVGRGHERRRRAATGERAAANRTGGGRLRRR